MTSERDSELKQHLTCFGSIDQSSHIETSGLTEPPHGLLHPVSRETYQLITFQTRTYVCRVDRLTCRVHWASAALQTIVAGHELWLIDSNHISGLTMYICCSQTSCRQLPHSSIFKRIYTGAFSSSVDLLGLEHMCVELQFLAVELGFLASTRFQIFSYSRHIDAVSSGRCCSSFAAITARVRFLYPAYWSRSKCRFESRSSP